MKLPELGSVWVDKSVSKQSDGSKVVVYKSDARIVEYTYSDINIKSNRGVRDFYRDFRPFEDDFDYKGDSNEIEMRYFYVTYSAEGATGACTLTTTKFINHKDFIKNLNKVTPDLKNPFITSWVEMTEEEYELFTE